MTVLTTRCVGSVMIIALFLIQYVSAFVCMRKFELGRTISSRNKNTIRMSYEEEDMFEIPEELGVLPFPIQDIMMPGESKKLHLYEARFLSLFQDAMLHRDQLVVQAVIVNQPNGAGFCPTGVLLKITEWDRLEVGVTATVKSIGRVRLFSFPTLDPYLSASVKYFGDKALTLEKTDALKALTEEIYELHDCCRQLHLKLASKDFPDLPDIAAQFDAAGAQSSLMSKDGDDDERMTWGHEERKIDNLGFEIPLKIQLQYTVEALNGEITSDLLCGNNADSPNASPELFSFQASNCLDSNKRLKALETRNTIKRMRDVIDSFTETKKILVAKAALSDLNF